MPAIYRLSEKYFKNAKFAYHSHPGGAEYDGFSMFQDVVDMTESDQFARLTFDNLHRQGKVPQFDMWMGSGVGNFYFMGPNSSNYNQWLYNYNELFNYLNPSMIIGYK